VNKILTERTALLKLNSDNKRIGRGYKKGKPEVMIFGTEKD